MLTGLRKQATGLVAQILLGMLVLSFAVWGVSDIFRGFNIDTVAKVGPAEVTAAEFQTAYQRQMQQFQSQTGQVITPDIARQMGIPSQVLAQLITEKIVVVQADRYGMGISDAKLAEEIRTVPTFQGANGFERSRLELVLYQNNWTERQFVNLYREAELQRQLETGLTGGLNVPKVLARAVEQLTGEARSVSYLVLGRDLAGEIPAPTDEELTAYLGETRGQWRTPEYRGIVVLRATPADLADPATITPEDLQAEYERQGARFSVAEEREITQLLYRDQASVDAAAARLAAGETFDALLANPAGGARIDLGTVARSEVLDPAIADAAFALESGATSAVIDGQYGFSILRVGTISPAEVTPLADVEATLREEMATERASDEILDLYDRVEDARAGGATLAEVGQEFNLPVQTIDAVTRNGLGPDGAEIEGLTDAPELLSAAFGSDVGLENDAVEPEAGGFVWYEVTSLIPARDQTLDEVRTALTEAWRNRQIDNRVAEKATAIETRLGAGETIETVATELGLMVQTAENVTRYAPATEPFSSAARDAAFLGPAGHVAVAAGAEAGTRIVLDVNTVTVPPPVDTPPAALADIGNELASDIIQQYLAAVQSQLGVTVNNDLVQQVIGGTL